VPVPDELLGSRLRAVVCAEHEGELSRDEVLEHCRRRLPAYMVPDAVDFYARLPQTSTGKIDRVELASASGGQSDG
jgi:long-chain acyl-CoA synthetase